MRQRSTTLLNTFENRLRHWIGVAQRNVFAVVEISYDRLTKNLLVAESIAGRTERSETSDAIDQTQIDEILVRVRRLK